MFTFTCLQVLRWGGLGIWGALLLSLLRGEAAPADPRVLAATLGAGAAYLLSFWRATDATCPAVMRRRWSLGLSASALVLHGVFVTHPLVGALLVGVAGVLPMHLNLGPTLAWLAAQSAGLLLLARALGAPLAPADALWSLGMQGGLALTMVLVFRHLQLRREWLQSAAQLARQAREAERTRIARDLHDLLGHDLTLLGAELEYARHFRDEEAVGRARALAARLFDDVRGTVGALRQAPGGWVAVLRPLDVAVPGLRLHVSLPPGTPAPEPTALGALAMVVQEALTNMVRHVGATNFFLEVRREDGAVVVALRDDGRAREPLVPGHGLRGMGERLEEVGGSLTVRTLPLGNVLVEASVPLAQGWP